MTSLSELKDFVAKSQRLTHYGDLEPLLDDAVALLGFDFYAIGHHVDLEFPPEDAIVLVKYPAAWLDLIMKHRYFADDPVLQASQMAVAPFAWDDVEQYIALSPRQKLIMDQAPRRGLGGGFTVPIHVAGEFSGSCSFGVRTGRDLPDSLHMAQYLACYIFEAARRLRRIERIRGNVGGGRRISLSPRQRDCLVLMARGFTDKEIARKINLKPDTVHEYVEEAKQRFGVKKRPQLLVRALYEGELAFGDVLGAPSPH